MRVFTCLLLQFLLPQGIQAQDLEPFAGRIYTPDLVTDRHSQGDKGDVQLLWQKMGEGVRYDLEIDNGVTVFSSTTERHFFYTKLYFNHDYRWRVRAVGKTIESGFSQWQNIKVVSEHQRELSSQEPRFRDVQEVAIDRGGS